MTAVNAADALRRAEAHSPFLAGLIRKQPGITELLKSGDYSAALDTALGTALGTGLDTGLGTGLAHNNSSDDTDISRRLRTQKQGVALVAAIADLAGAWDLAQVTRTLSDFADTALDTAISHAIRDRYDTHARGFTVIALGKHGGRELNYSSDIDPIFIYDPKILPHREREDVAEAAVRIGKRVIDLLNSRDEHGYVFRVDMRLRPSSEVSPVSLPVDGAISHYESSALAWEQAAFIRARIAAGDKDVGRYFLGSIDSFIWRRSLDFGQLQNIQRMTAQIRKTYTKGQSLGPGYDLKRGRGGIRECEFYAQAHQLIHGGRRPELRVPDTRAALRALADAGCIAAGKAQALSDAYGVLRHWEHRLQMVDDRQTHHLPDSEEAFDNLAQLGGLAGGAALLDELRPHIEAVSAIYDDLAQDDAEGDADERAASLADEGAPLQEQLGEMGFVDVAGTQRRIKRWRSRKLRAIRSDSAVAAFEAVLPALLRALAKAPDPEMALSRFDNIAGKLPSAINFFHLLGARPALLQLLADILSYAPTLADALTKKTDMLDRLIEANALELKIDMEQMRSEMQGRVDGLDYERQLDVVRDYVSEHRFTLGVQLIVGRQDAMELAEGYSALAEAALRVLTQAASDEFAMTHGRVAGGELLVLALGRLGGEALTHASDLDLVFLFTGDFDAQSDGEKPLSAAQYFNRLASRAVGALSVPTASGALYEIDTRLRPSGAQGLLCASIDAFSKYQRDEAWTWEHMALARARPVFGSQAAIKRLDAIVRDTLSMPRDPEKLRTDVVQMRRDMAVHKPASGPLDIKLLPGGLVDLEFIVHYLQLRHHVGLHPQLSKAIRALSLAGHLPSDFLDRYNLLGRILVTIRLVAPDCDIPPDAARILVATSLGFGDWQDVMTAIEEARSAISTQWEMHLGARNF